MAILLILSDPHTHFLSSTSDQPSARLLSFPSRNSPLSVCKVSFSIENTRFSAICYSATQLLLFEPFVFHIIIICKQRTKMGIPFWGEEDKSSYRFPFVDKEILFHLFFISAVVKKWEFIPEPTGLGLGLLRWRCQSLKPLGKWVCLLRGFTLCAFIG